MSNPLKKAIKAVEADQREKDAREKTLRYLRNTPLWDVFTAHALGGFVSSPNPPTPANAAHYACEYADSMVLERNRRING